MILLVLLWTGLAWAQAQQFKNAAAGTTYTCPAGFMIVDDPKVMQQITQKGADAMNVKGQLRNNIQQVGVQFTAFKRFKKAPAFLSNMCYTTEKLPSAGFSDEAYRKAAMDVYERAIPGSKMHLGKGRKIAGVPFLCMEVELSMPGRGSVFNRTYCHVDSSRQVAHVIAFTDNINTYKKTLPALEEPLLSGFHFDFK